MVRLLASPVISRSEIAALIRRNCLAFSPTERDWADLQSLGADPEVLGSVSACTDRSKAREIAPASAFTVVPLTTRIVTPPDTDASVRIQVKRGGIAEAGVALILRGASDIQGVTDQRGMAEFALRAGRVAGTYSLSVRLAGAAPSSRDPVVELVVQPAAPAVAEFAPTRVTMDSADAGPVNLEVVVRDAFGNAVPGEAVGLRGEDPEMNLSLEGVRTDSLGRAVFVIAPRTIRRAGPVAIVVREATLASLRAAFAVPASSQSRFVAGSEQVGMAGTQVNAPLVFQVRAGSGRPLAGRVVAFTAQNAEVTPDHAISDGAGLAQVQVTLGPKAGAAVVIASVDSVQTKATLAGPACGAGHRDHRAQSGCGSTVGTSPFPPMRHSRSVSPPRTSTATRHPSQASRVCSSRCGIGSTRVRRCSEWKACSRTTG